jgi:hypothetical protein
MSKLSNRIEAIQESATLAMAAKARANPILKRPSIFAMPPRKLLMMENTFRIHP